MAGIVSAVYTQPLTGEGFSMPGDALSAGEREEIRAGIERDDSLRAIARDLGRHPATICREVKRNGGHRWYNAGKAQRRADRQRCRPKVAKLVADEGLAAHVSGCLVAKDSPTTISIELARGVHGFTASISPECIYQAIYAGGARGLDRGLHKGLHLKRRRRRSRTCTHNPGVTHPLGVFTLISQRPPIALERSEVGHFEGDLIVGAYNRSALVTIFDRASRYLWLAGLTNKTAEATFETVCRTLERIPERVRHTLAWDQGSEMARHHLIAELCRIDIYFADPKSPWQRPTNENGNALVRRYVGKGTDLAIYTPAQLQAIETRINTIPRRSLGWATAHDIYTAGVATTG